MIAIISDDNDNSTNKVIDWLIAKKRNFVRINGEESLFLNEALIKQNLFNLNVENNLLLSLSSLWYRRGRVLIKNPPVSLLDHDFNKELEIQINDEKRTISEYVYKKIYDSARIRLGDYTKTKDLNKFDVLEKAKAVGLDIPATIITSSKKTLIPFSEEYKLIITKAASDVRSFHYAQVGYIYTYTNLIEKIDSFPEFFFPSLFQQYIDKKYEIRAFYINKKIFSMAIFSQNDGNTRIDFRNYNDQFPNRNVPYNLPVKVIKKLIRLMNSLGLDTGSLDLIVDKHDRYFFLEVNPVGQYDMVSSPCNYNLHKIIATELSK